MKYTLEIHRCSRGEKRRYVQIFSYTTENDSETIATVLTNLNAQPLVDISGNSAAPIVWQCSCLQKKCGACAMVINGKPGLACARKLSECGSTVRLEPLRKFPVVEDLMVDRSIMQENLRMMKLWFESSAVHTEKNTDIGYEASRCLQCGCCLEVCPNFASGGEFTGMAAAVPMTRLLSELTGEQKKEASRLYDRHVYEGCGKSLACRSICPAKIDTDRMLVNSNAIAVWKKLFGR